MVNNPDSARYYSNVSFFYCKRYSAHLDALFFIIHTTLSLNILLYFFHHRLQFSQFVHPKNFSKSGITDTNSFTLHIVNIKQIFHHKLYCSGQGGSYGKHTENEKGRILGAGGHLRDRRCLFDLGAGALLYGSSRDLRTGWNCVTHLPIPFHNFQFIP